MYKFYMDSVLLPVSPPKLETSIKNQNKTIVLINEGEINILKSAGLTEIAFEIILPIINNYPFAVYSKGFQTAGYYLEKFEALKTSKKPFQFVVSRKYGKKIIFSTNMKVSLEDYTITEDAEEGDCIKVSINLKQYREYSTKTVDIKLTSYKPVVKVTTTRSASTSTTTKKTSSTKSTKTTKKTTKSVTKGCTVIVNGYLYRDSYGNGRGQYRKNYKGKVNFINLKGSHPYHITTPSGGWQGWVLKSAVVVQ